MAEKKNLMNDDELDEIVGGIILDCPANTAANMADQVAVALEKNNIDLEEGVVRIKSLFARRRPDFAKEKIEEIAGLIKDRYKKPNRL